MNIDEQEEPMEVDYPDPLPRAHEAVGVNRDPAEPLCIPLRDAMNVWNYMSERTLLYFLSEEQKRRIFNETAGCAICQFKFTEEEHEHGGFMLALTPCKHLYHGHCLIEWLLISSSCPLCRGL